MSLDRDLLTRKMLLIAQDFDGLAAIRDRGLDAYRGDRRDQAVAERHLERMIGRMIDINYHVLTESGHPPPADYHASFVQAGALGALEPAFARRLASSAGLRTRIVHEYDQLDHDRVFEALSAALHDVPEYLASVNRYLELALPAENRQS